MNSTPKTIKLVMVGDTNVGKTSLIHRYIEDQFHEFKPNTVGVDFFAKKMEINGKLHTIQVWDTAGQERFRSIIKSYFKNARALILVYDMTKRETFESLSSWIELIHETARPDCIIFVVGNKVDLADKRAVSYEEAKAFADNGKYFYSETSAKISVGIDILFESIIKELIEILDQAYIENDDDHRLTIKQRPESKGIFSGEFSCC